MALGGGYQRAQGQGHCRCVGGGFVFVEITALEEHEGVSLVQAGVFAGARLWVVDTKEHKDRDIAEELPVVDDTQEEEAGFKGTGLAGGFAVTSFPAADADTVAVEGNFSSLFPLPSLVPSEELPVVDDAQKEEAGFKGTGLAGSFPVTSFPVADAPTVAADAATVAVEGVKLDVDDAADGHEGPVWQVTWAHPKFRSILASCSYDRKVIIWKETSENQWIKAQVFSDHEGSVNSISWAPHEYGLVLACASSDGSISILTHRADGGWDASRIPQAHPVGVTSVSWAPATVPGSFLGSGPNPVLRFVSGGCDNMVKIWRYSSEGGGGWRLDGAPPGLARHTDWVRDVAWAPNLGLPKSTIASASQDGTVLIWTQTSESDPWKPLLLQDFKVPVWRVSWSLTGNILAVSDANNNVSLWKEAADGQWSQVSTIQQP
ncbi:unnamed protein product [Closterium sp. Naga37s-1]|nr:unnamed protein product [Closterium sp. Naga37s-1]